MFSDNITGIIQILTLTVMIIGLGGYAVRYVYKKYHANVDKLVEAKESEDRIKYFDDCIHTFELFKTTVGTTFDGLNGSVNELEKSVAVITRVVKDIEPYTKIINEHSNRLTRVETYIFNGKDRTGAPNGG